MKRLLGFTLAVCFVSFLNIIGLVILAGGLRSSVAGPPPCVAGDVNGDGSVNMGDPVYLLEYLFNMGADPVACAQDPPIPPLEGLNQYLPRAQDLFDRFILLGGNETFEITVPPGKVFVLTHYLSASGGIEVLRNGEPFTFIDLNGIFFVQVAGSFRSTFPVRFSFQPGDVFSLRNTTPDYRNVMVWGYWAEHAP